MEYRLSKSIQGIKSSAVRDILRLTQGKSIISLAGGLPAEQLFPIEAVRDAFARVFDQGSQCLQYGLTEGYVPLREQICDRLTRKNMHVDIEHMILTTGSQQAIDLLVRVYLDPGDVILVENPTYLAALQVFATRNVRVIPVDGDKDGMDLNDLALKLKLHQPKMVYVIPTFSNPTGNVWNIERRIGLLSLCREHQVLILEDDPYGELQYESDEHYPTLFSLDQHPKGSIVVYTSTFSKIVAPALRTGWAIGDTQIIQAMTRSKQAADLQSSTMDQQALYQLLTHFDLDKHISTIRASYKLRMQTMVRLLHKQEWDQIHWNDPKGGMFLWMKLPQEIDAEQLLVKAVQEGVAFVPGASFYAAEQKRNTLRLNFTHTDPDLMESGITRLAKAIHSYEVDQS